MHIAFLTTEYPTTLKVKTGGIGTTIKNQVSLLLAKNVKVTVLLWTPLFFNNYEEDGVQIICIKKKPGKGLKNTYKQQKDLESQVNHLCEILKIDLVETTDWEGNTAFVHLNIPVVMRFQGSNLFFGRLLNKKVPLTINILERLSVFRADAYIGVSQQSFDLSYDIFKFKKNKPATIIYNPVDLHHVIKYTNNSLPGKNIVFYGTLAEKKGVLLIPRIFNEIVKHYPDAKLTMIGKDTIFKGNSMKSQILKMFSEEAFFNVSFIDHLPYDDLLKEVAKNNICLLPSYAETFGLVLLEGMGLKKAVVCSDIEPFMEIARDQIDCIHCPVGNADSFTNALLDIMADDDKYLFLAENAYQRAFDKFAPEKLAEQHISFYNKVLSHTP